MADEKMSAEDKEKMRELQKTFLRGNVSSVIGMNGVYAMGEDGRNIADSESLSSRFNEQRKSLWNDLKESNVSNLPVEMPTNQAVVNYGVKSSQEALKLLNIDDLYEVVQGVRNTKYLKDNPVPDKFKGKGLEDIAEEFEKAKGDVSKISDDAKEIYSMHKSLSDLYAKKATERTFCYNNGIEQIETYKAITEKYKPKEESKDSE